MFNQRDRLYFPTILTDQAKGHIPCLILSKDKKQWHFTATMYYDDLSDIRAKLDYYKDICELQRRRKNDVYKKKKTSRLLFLQAAVLYYCV